MALHTALYCIPDPANRYAENSFPEIDISVKLKGHFETTSLQFSILILFYLLEETSLEMASPFKQKQIIEIDH